MNADLFYETRSVRAIPFYLISQAQWDEGLEHLTAVERNYLTVRQFKGKTGDYCLIHNADGVIEKAYIGCGSGNEESALAHAAVLLPAGCYKLQGSVSQGASVAWALAQYRFTAFKKYEVQARTLIVDEQELPDVLALAQAIYLIRDLVNQPASHMGPSQMADVISGLASRYNAEFRQWVGDELVKDNFPAIHAVGRASASAPRLLSLAWGNEKHPRVTLVGKGVCFDSGGLDIKPSAGMRFMKKDMGGAAHVIGLAQWIMARGLPVRLQVLVPAVENSIGSDAFRPGDILTMRNGLTVEIENTDAEGRLVLADALVKACEDRTDLLIDFATLTGAARVAVGTDMAAMFSNSDSLAEAIARSSAKVNDPVWRMPLFSAYEDFLNSSVADMANSSASPYAGAIVAALFLQRFIDKSVPWVHFDVMAWNVGNKPGRPEGGEAMGFRAVADYLLQTYG